MTQLPRIGDKVVRHGTKSEWTVSGVNDDYGTPTGILLRHEGWGYTQLEPADTFWQHWTPATQRTT